MSQSNGVTCPENQKKNLEELVARYSANADYYRRPANNYNEHSCRDEYLNPLLRILGWDVENTKGIAPQLREVIAENFSSESERPDYSLTIRGVPQFFVEAKKPSVHIDTNPEPSLQARKYGWNANHKIAVLTNFENLMIFDTSVMPKPDDTSSVARFRKYHYTEYVERIDEIYSLLSREVVYSGAFDTYIADELALSGATKERVDQVFLGQINEWRVALAESLYANSPLYHNPEKLNDAIQCFINQIIFLRICEDKKLPVYQRLCDLTKQKDGIDSELISQLRIIDKRYNSGLFEETSALPLIDEKVLKGIIEALYYPQSPYLFDIIDPSLFGQIYELFLAEQVVVSDEGIAYLTPKKEYQDRSVITTPIEVVRYIVDNALRPLAYGKSPEEIKNLRIADISCGSGIFLLEAFQFLVDQCINWYFENDRAHLIEIGNGQLKLPFEEKKSLLKSCMYGLDIDSHAVEVAKFSLLIKLIDNEAEPTVETEKPILPKLDDNICLGNALVDETEAMEFDASCEDMEYVIPFDWNRLNEGAPFDAIIGNPPYVKTEDMHTLLPKSELEIYKKHYKSSYRQFDKYFLFIEQALNRVVEKGYVCLIVPNKFFKIASGRNLRGVISEGQFLTSLDDFGDSQLFEDRTVYSSILCLQNCAHATFNYASISSPADLWSGDVEDTVVLDSQTIGRDPWRLTTDIDFLKKLVEMEDVAVPITKHIVPFNGIQTSAETKRTYWFLDSEVVSENDKTITVCRNENVWSIEKVLLKRFFKPTEEHGYNSYSPLECDKWLIFPYDSDGVLFPEDTMKEVYPNAWKYLNSRKEELWPKQLPGDGNRDVTDATASTWYRYGRTQALTSFNNQEKIIVGILSEEPLYYIDRDDWVIASGGTAGYCGIKMKPESPYALEYIQAWLTNHHTEKIFEMIGSDFEGGFKSRGTSLLKTLPFVELDFTDEAQTNLYEDVVEKSQRIQVINSELSEHPSRRRSTVLEREKHALIKSISAQIDSIYSLRFCK